MPLTKEESFLILDKEINELDEKISYINKKNAELKLNISLTEEEEFFYIRWRNQWINSTNIWWRR